MSGQEMEMPKSDSEQVVEFCQKYHQQWCHICPRLECCDNQNYRMQLRALTAERDRLKTELEVLKGYMEERSVLAEHRVVEAERALLEEEDKVEKLEDERDRYKAENEAMREVVEAAQRKKAATDAYSDTEGKHPAVYLQIAIDADDALDAALDRYDATRKDNHA